MSSSPRPGKATAPPAKRKRTATGLIPADPLKKVPNTLGDITMRAGFTVCDLVIVLKLMGDMFDLRFWFRGPCEGSIHIREGNLHDFDRYAWITEKEAASDMHYGLKTELRFSGSNDSGSEALRCLHEALSWHRRLATLANLKITDKHDDAVEKIVGTSADYKKQFTNDDMRRILGLPMPLLLHAGYPYYSWPRWLFGAFEGLVMRRVQMVGAQKPQ